MSLHIFILIIWFSSGYSLGLPARLIQPVRGFTRRLKPVERGESMALFQVYNLDTNKRLDVAKHNLTKPQVASKLLEACQKIRGRLSRNSAVPTQKKSKYIAQVYDEHLFQKRKNLESLIHDPECSEVIQNLVDLKREYDSLVQNLSNYEKKHFLFFPLRASTNPMAGTYWSQLEACSALANSLQQHGLFLFIKEHPHMLQCDVLTCKHLLKHNQFPRFKGFYSSLLKRHSNIILLPVESDADSYIVRDECIGVYTVEGSSGLTSIIANKVTYYSGDPWYSSYSSCFPVEEIDERISSNLSRPTRLLTDEELKDFANEASHHVYTIDLNTSDLAKTKISYDFLM